MMILRSECADHDLDPLEFGLHCIGGRMLCWRFRTQDSIPLVGFHVMGRTQHGHASLCFDARSRQCLNGGFLPQDFVQSYLQ